MGSLRWALSCAANPNRKEATHRRLARALRKQHAREVTPREPMRRSTLVAAIIVAAALTTPTVASASCQTHRCWQKVHIHHLERMVEKRIARIAPYRCFGFQSVKPCQVIAQESATSGFWTAYNTQSCGSGFHARGLYQLCGHGEPWPVIVTWGRRLWRHYETLKRELAHHRIAARLGLGHWGM